jgi:hypothetical protein
MRRTRESVESVAASFTSRRCGGLMAPAGIDGGDEAVRNGAAQDDLFAATPSRARAATSASEKPRAEQVFSANQRART